ncbi:MAG: Gfo/Idh/MocA family oxidoreductase [Paracoccaceae bacterium]|nr:Gfo/Idh/MocA family oxidoreductase [Paracoccaceae bacterium]MDG1368904.1 Gfo/Idh/MocA family oxidoreductase [Paracoccaceae bacterium]
MRPAINNPRIAVVGAGLIGQRHAKLILDGADAMLSAIVDPTGAARSFAGEIDAPWYASIADMLVADRPDGLIVATPNQLHLDHGLQAVEAGLPALIEKPIADSVAAAEKLVSAAEAAKIPLLIGHHRRHNPLIADAKANIDAGQLGKLVAVNAMFWLYKPDDYFDVEWRRKPGAGPVYINLIHDIDLLRHLVGEVASVQAIQSSAARGHEVEDTAAALLTFENGALGTISASDGIVGPWSWEQTAGENPAYPETDQHCYLIGGTKGSLSLPNGEIWGQDEPRSWWRDFQRSGPAIPSDADPLVRQIAHFCDVIRGQAAPLVSGREGLQTLNVIEALKQSADTGETITLI